MDPTQPDPPKSEKSRPNPTHGSTHNHHHHVRVAGEGRRVVAPPCPRSTARLQSSPIGRVESFRSWSSHLFRGRPGERRQSTRPMDNSGTPLLCRGFRRFVYGSGSCMAVGITELSMGPFCVTRSNPTHGSTQPVDNCVVSRLLLQSQQTHLPAATDRPTRDHATIPAPPLLRPEDDSCSRVESQSGGPA